MTLERPSGPDGNHDYEGLSPVLGGYCSLMLNTTIEIWPLGALQHAEQIAHIAIWNDGTGNHQLGNYGYAITVEADSRFFNQATLPTELELRDMARAGAFDDDRIRATGHIHEHPRADGSTVLLGKVLVDAGLAG